MSTSMSSFEGRLASPRRRAAFGLAGAIAAGALALGLATASPAVSAYADEVGAATPAAAETGDISLAERVAADVLPSVGSVNALIDDGYQQGLSQGSCEVITEDGYILTNYHVIEGSTQVQVVLNDDAYDAQVVGSDPTSDVAVLKIEPDPERPLTPIKIGDSSQVAVGQWVMTLGSPYGESESVSAGIVSGLSRTAAVDLQDTVAYYPGLIQSDAMINSGSSGGAMVNADGEFIGMTTLSGSQSGDWAGMTYAIPSNYAMGIAQQIIETGTVEHPQLGASVANLLEAYYQNAYDMNDLSALGAYVVDVVEGSGAAAAGLKPGDVIKAVNDIEITYPDELIIAVRSYAIGDTVTLTVDRNGEELLIDVVLGSDASTAAASAADAEDEDANPFGFLGWGNGGSDTADEGQGGDGGWGGNLGGGNGGGHGDGGHGIGWGWGWGWGI